MLRFFTLLSALLLAIALPAAAQEGDATAATGHELHIKDGQLLSHPLSAYVQFPLGREEWPMLCLMPVAKPEMTADHCFGALDVIADQGWTDTSEGGSPIFYRGTLLQFDASKLIHSKMHWLKSMIGFTPRLVRGDGKGNPILPLDTLATTRNGHLIYLGNPRGALLWTVLIVAGFLFIVIRLAGRAYRERGEERPSATLMMVSTADGRMSMALTQMALWTVAVGTVVLGFGLIRMSVPDLPDTLIWLMGLAASTSAVGHWQTQREALKAGDAGLPKTRPAPCQLLTVRVNGQEEVSLAKAQILFWTVVTLILFVVKSLTDGQLWDIPEELVGLMGISQATFLSRQQMALSQGETGAG